ncbi:hypothetical protein [Sphingomonas sp. MS122]|uniref:hypothetical protein n=1 Tax=Sphingomonas sp. MS122 TaxID=3412683 RepID=UPI003C2B09D4
MPGSNAGLRFVERARLDPGKLMLYRMRRDVHVQLPPDSFSVSLNILGQHPSHPWIDQYRFDITRGTIAEGLTTAPAEALVTLAAHLGGDNGLELVEHLVRRHPHPRMRQTAVQAMASARGESHAMLRLLEFAVDDDVESVRVPARRKLEILSAGPSELDHSPADS